ncbi:MAG: hypothetical protein WA709_19715 [Stellaceae bacterium]
MAKFLQTQRDQRLLQTQGERQNIVTVAVHVEATEPSTTLSRLLGRSLIATRDDLAAMYAKNAIEMGSTFTTKPSGAGC